IAIFARAFLHRSGNHNHPFAAQLVCLFAQFRIDLLVKRELRTSVSISQIDERHTPHLADFRYPTRQCHYLIFIGQLEFAARTVSVHIFYRYFSLLLRCKCTQLSCEMPHNFTTLSTTCSNSFKCVAINIVMPGYCDRIFWKIAIAFSMLMPAVGSSTTSSCGLLSRACASSSFLRCPPLNVSPFSPKKLPNPS